jgi:hypothetical protein
LLGRPLLAIVYSFPFFCPLRNHVLIFRRHVWVCPIAGADIMISTIVITVGARRSYSVFSVSG